MSNSSRRPISQTEKNRRQMEANREQAARDARKDSYLGMSLQARVEAHPMWTVGLQAMEVATRETLDAHFADLVTYLRASGGWTAILTAAFAAAVHGADVEGPFTGRVTLVSQLTGNEINTARNAGMR
jgi:phosphoserine phosphatase